MHPLTKRFSVLVEQVGNWSRENFGLQASKFETFRLTEEMWDRIHPVDPGYNYPVDLNDISVILGSVAPLLGMIEECGELADAFTHPDILIHTRDAVGDVFIYLADFFYRSGTPLYLLTVADFIDWDEIDTILKIEAPVSTYFGNGTFLLRRLGTLTHVILKRHQGIRQYTDREFYLSELREALKHVLIGIGRLYFSARWEYAKTSKPPIEDPVNYCHVTCADMLTITEQTWVLVRRRNWKKNPQSGVPS